MEDGPGERLTPSYKISALDAAALIYGGYRGKKGRGQGGLVLAQVRRDEVVKLLGTDSDVLCTDAVVGQALVVYPPINTLNTDAKRLGDLFRTKPLHRLSGFVFRR